MIHTLDLHTPGLPKLQRSNGSALVALGRRGKGRVETLAQAGSARVFLLGLDEPVPEIVLLNTSGGLASGDRLAFELSAAPHVSLVATTQTAERAYRASGGAARVDVTIRAGRGARVDWLPQETILFDGAALCRRTDVELGRDAACLLAETVVLGRAAMGEQVRRVALEDRRLVRRQGRPVWAEILRLDDGVLEADRIALLGPARAIATVALIAAGAEDAVGAVRQAIGTEGVEVAVSGWDGKCVVRIAGRDGWPVRRQVARVLGVLGGGALPRVWQE